MDDYLNRMYFGIPITVCAKAEERCPTFPGLGERHYWPVDDPVTVEGSEEEKLAPFRRAGDGIEQHLLD